MPRVSDHPARGLQAKRTGESCGRSLQGLAEQSLQPAGRQAHGPGGVCDGFWGVDPRLHACQSLCDARVKAVVGGGGRGNLRVGTGARGGQEGRGNLAGYSGAVAGADQMQHQVSGRGGAACGKALAVDHPAVGDDINLRVGGGEVLQVFPMHCGAVTGEQTGAGQHPSPRINPADGCKTRRHAGKVADQRGGRPLGLPETGDDDQSVGAFGGG